MRQSPLWSQQLHRQCTPPTTSLQSPNPTAQLPQNLQPPQNTQLPLLIPKLVPIQVLIFACYPLTVFLGILSNHPRESYFSRKDNFINVLFLKSSWGWTSLAFFAHLIGVPQKVGPLVRYGVATIWWYLVTQWCFGPPIMDKVFFYFKNLIDDQVFRGTGGICQLAKNEEFPNIFTSAVCRSSGGAWNGGHDLVWSTFLCF